MSTDEQTQPLFLTADVPGIFLPQNFRFQPADKNLVKGVIQDTGNPPKEKVSGDSQGGQPLVDVLPFLTGSWSGPGFNQIFRPESEVTRTPNQPKDDNILELNLTHEHWTFSGELGDIPNRGSGQQRDINLDGISYVQSVQDTTDSRGGRLRIDRLGNLYGEDGDKIARTPDNNRPRTIHFESGIFLNIPRSLVNAEPGMARMASIPHGTTIHLQGNAALRDKDGPPSFGNDKFTPFLADTKLADRKIIPKEDDAGLRVKRSQDIVDNSTARLPQNLDLHKDSISNGMKEVIVRPDSLLVEHNKTKKITHTFTWRLKNSLLPTQSNALKQAIGILTKVSEILVTKSDATPGVTTDELKSVSALLQRATNLANIGFLDGTSGANTNAAVASVLSIFWVSRVEYTFTIEKDWTPVKDQRGTVTNPLRITPNKNSSGQDYVVGTVPEFCFPLDAPGIKAQIVTVYAMQMQYSQTVILNFQGLSWPHMSVATVVPLEVNLEMGIGGSFTSATEKMWQDTLAMAVPKPKKS